MATQSPRSAITRYFLPAVLGLLLPATLQAETRQWQVCHRGDVKALRIFTVGEAQLLRYRCDRSQLLVPPVRLSFAYNRDVPGDAFAKAAMNFLEKNLTADRFQSLKPQLDAFNSHYQDVSDGDRYTLSWENQQLQLALNGTVLTTQSGDDFAQDYLTIWFGESPYSTKLKRALLGES